MLEIFQDICSGALPATELPGFFVYQLKRASWFILVLVWIGVLILLAR